MTMKFSDLQVGQKAILENKEYNYRFSGNVKQLSDGRIWLTNGNQGYIINSKYNDLWIIKILK